MAREKVQWLDLCISYVANFDGIGDGNHNSKSSRHHDERFETMFEFYFAKLFLVFDVYGQ
jgi:hypothetical protein